MGNLPARLRLSLAEWFTVLAALLVVSTLVGGWLTYTGYVAPGTHVEQRSETVAEYTGAYSHRATVTRSNPVFPTGSTLSNRSVYFASVAPVVDGSFTYQYAAPEGSVDVRATLALVVRSVGTGENRTEYWRVDRAVDRTSADGLPPGTPVRLQFSQNVSAVAARVAAIRESLGETPGEVQVRFVTTVRATGTVDSRQVDLSHRYAMPLQIEGDTYRLSGGSTTDSATATRSVSVPNTPGPIRTLGGPLLTAVAGLALAGLLAARSRGELDVTDADRERLAYRRERDEFDEWITTASLPNTLLDAPFVEVESLEGLVDVAIDSNARVVEDPSRKQYVVPGDAVVYVYTPPGTAVDADGE